MYVLNDHYNTTKWKEGIEKYIYTPDFKKKTLGLIKLSESIFKKKDEWKGWRQAETKEEMMKFNKNENKK